MKKKDKGLIRVNPNEQHRSYSFLLYPDNEKHVAALSALRDTFSHVGILHYIVDTTLVSKNDSGVIIEGQGKPHNHVYTFHEYPVKISTICNVCGFVDSSGNIDTQFVRPLSVKRGRYGADDALGYLIHFNSPDKESYSITDLFGTRDCVLKAEQAVVRLARAQYDMPDSIRGCLSWISKQTDIITAFQFGHWITGSPYFKASNSWIVRECIAQHNQRIYARENRFDYDYQNASSILRNLSNSVYFDISETYSLEDLKHG